MCSDLSSIPVKLFAVFVLWSGRTCQSRPWFGACSIRCLWCWCSGMKETCCESKKLLFGCQVFIRGDELLDSEEPPEGYYAFIESPSAVPPKVRSPPYTHINIECKEATNPKPYVSANNLCGDLNKGKIPRNPMKQNVLGEPYPFELIRNQTLKFLSKTLPVLKADDTLPKVTQIIPDEPVDQFDDNGIGRRMGKAMRMEEERRVEEDIRAPRKFCDGGGVFCALYRAIQGEPISSKLVAERREEAAAYPPPPRYEGPPTPCPAKVEYATPVFAKNYQGSWRYVVQIPYEGYFTQTVEVTRCLQARCHYLDGGCLSSPRWVSLLVAEIFYPNAEEQAATAPTTTTTTAPSIQDFQAYQQYLQKRAGLPTDNVYESGVNGGGPQQQQQQPQAPTAAASTAKQNQHCDGHDEIGCFQVRLYYDWFLIPGSCKCWRPDYFAKYVRKRPSPDL